MFHSGPIVYFHFFARFRLSVLTDSSSACQGCYVPRDPGGRGGSHACSSRSHTTEQRTAAGRTIPPSQDGDCPPDKLPR